MTILAPIWFKGEATLSIGLLIKDSSPIREACIPDPHIRPIINLIPVPELPRSTGVTGLLKATSRLDIFTIPSSNKISEPI